MSYKASALQTSLSRDLGRIYSHAGVGSDFHQNNLTDEYLTQVMDGINDKTNFKIFMDAVKSNDNFFTTQFVKDSFLEKARVYGKARKLL